MSKVSSMFSNLQWSSFKEVVIRNKLKIHFVDESKAYYLMAVDGQVKYECLLSQEEPATDNQTDFEENFKLKANVPELAKNATTGAQKVSIEKPDDSSAVLITHDWCNKETWYQRSIRVEGENLTNASGKLYNSSKAFWIDLAHGKVYEEDKISATYLPVVKDSGTVINEGEHFDVDYKLGNITLKDTYTATGVISADFSYATSSDFMIEPKPGKILALEHSELNFLKDVVIDKHIIFEIWVGNPGFNVGLPESETNPMRVRYGYTTYKNEKDLISAGNQGQGSIPKFGNMTDDVLVFPFHYLTVKPFKSSLLTQLRVRLSKDINGSDTELNGSWGTAAFYVVSHDEI